jgi:hypothetical protein
MTDLKELLRSAAAEAENVSVDGSALIPTIRRRRRARTTVLGAGGVAAATTLAVGAYAVLPGAAPSDAPASQSQPKQCAATTRFQPTAGARVELTQKSMRQSGFNLWSGTVRIKLTNLTQYTLYTTNGPTDYIVVPEKGDQSLVGRAQAEPAKLNVVLKPGASHTSDLQLTVHACGAWKKLAGSYLVYESSTGVRHGTAIGRLQLP